VVSRHVIETRSRDARAAALMMSDGRPVNHIRTTDCPTGARGAPPFPFLRHRSVMTSPLPSRSIRLCARTDRTNRICDQCTKPRFRYILIIKVVHIKTTKHFSRHPYSADFNCFKASFVTLREYDNRQQ